MEISETRARPSKSCTSLIEAHGVDIGVIAYGIPRRAFHEYLRRFVDAGMIDRIMFGSDQMIWPETIGVAIDAIRSADFLTDAQKQAIFYGNAARFLRLTQAQQQRHRAMAAANVR